MAGHEGAILVEVVQKRCRKRIPRKAHRIAVAGHRHPDLWPVGIGIRGIVPEPTDFAESFLGPAPQRPFTNIRVVHFHDGVANLGRCDPFATAPMEEIRKAEPKTRRVVDQVPQTRPFRRKVAAQGRAGGRSVSLKNEADIAANVPPATLGDPAGEGSGSRNSAPGTWKRRVRLEGPATHLDEPSDGAGEVACSDLLKIRIDVNPREKTLEGQRDGHLLVHWSHSMRQLSRDRDRKSMDIEVIVMTK